jgi:hypothetical protein
VHEVALLLDHVHVVVPPNGIVLGDTEKLIVGSGYALTAIVFEEDP